MSDPNEARSAAPADLCIVAKFKMPSDAQMAQQVVEDFVNAGLEQRYPDVKAFARAWERRIPGISALGPTRGEFDVGLHDPCSVRRHDSNTVKVEHFTSAEVGGVIILLLLKSPVDIRITGQVRS